MTIINELINQQIKQICDNFLWAGDVQAQVFDQFAQLSREAWRTNDRHTHNNNDNDDSMLHVSDTMLHTSTQPPTLSGTGNEQRATGWRPSVNDWGGGMSASCKPRVQLLADAGNGSPHSVGSYNARSTSFGPLSTSEFVHGPHHHWRIRCLSRVWSGTTLCRTPVQLLCSSNSTS